MRSVPGLVSATAAFTAGIGTALSLPAPCHPGLVVVALVVVLVCIACRCRTSWLIALLLFGFAWASIAVQDRLSQRLPSALHGTDLVLTGTISGLVTQKHDRLSFRFVTDFAGLRRATVLVRWYQFDPERAWPRAGEQWQLRLRLRLPRGLANPLQPRMERYAFVENIAASAYVKPGPNQRLAVETPIRLDAMRQELSDQILTAIGQSPASALVLALAVANRSLLTEAHWQTMRRTGLSHLLAISGLHIGLVATAGYFLGAAIGSLWGRAVGPACALSATLALTYAALAGFPLPTQRALVVVLLLLWGCLRRRCVSKLHLLSAALALILIANPLAIMEQGLWLSFGAVAVIAYTVSGTVGGRGWRTLVRAQLAVSLGLIPLLILFFGEVSLVAPLMNSILVPVFGMVIVPAILLGLALLLLIPIVGKALMIATTALLDLIWKGLEWVALQDFVAVTPGNISIWLALPALIGVLVLLAPPGWPARWLGIIFFTPLLLGQAPRIDTGAVRLTVLDVGHGLAAIIQTRHHLLIYDTGPAWPGSSAAQRVVLPYLYSLRSGPPDLAVISHGDNDHAGGLEPLRTRYPEMEIVAGDDVPGVRCRAGMTWNWDQVRFAVLHPADATRWTGNNASCVIRISTVGQCMLLTGDIEAPAEQALVQRGGVPQCAVVVAPHHGSETSSTLPFVKLSSAQLVLFSTSFRNHWRFPRPTVVERWQRHGAAGFATGESGAITVTIDVKGRIQMKTERCRRKRIWQSSCITSAAWEPDSAEVS